jgi:hypothetical protein
VEVVPGRTNDQGGGDSQSSNNSTVAAAVGGGLGGLAVLAALVLFVLFKRKKNFEEPGDSPAGTSMSGEENQYISQYGLSDAPLDGDRHDGDGDGQKGFERQDELNEDGSGASENNPNESEVVGEDPD